MTKGKCINGHFIDLDRFTCCPICGGGIAGRTENKKTGTPAPATRKTRLDDVDKTELLIEEDISGMVPETGEAGGLKWRFRSEKREPAPTEPESVIKTDPVPDPTPADPVEQTQTAPADSSLTDAVAATGHGTLSALPKTVAYSDLAQTEPPTGWLVCVAGVYQGRAFMCKTGQNKIGRNPNCDIIMRDDTSMTRESHAVIIYEPIQRVFYLQSDNGLVYLNGRVLFLHEHKELHAYDKIQMGSGEFVFLPLCGDRFTWDDHIS